MQPTPESREVCQLLTKQPNTVTLRRWRVHLLCAALLLPSLLGLARPAEPEWIPPFSSDLDALVREIEDAQASGEVNSIRDTLGDLAERLMDGDPGGCTPLGAGISIGAGEYLRSTVARLDRPLRETVLEEIRLRAVNRISTTPIPGLDGDSDRRRISILLDLPRAAIPATLARQLAESALERGEIQLWKRLVAQNWSEPRDLFTADVERLGSSVDIAPGTLLLPIHRSGEAQPQSPGGATWKTTRGASGAVSRGNLVWIQQPDQIQAIDLASTEELWRRVLPQQSRPLPPRTSLQPVRRGNTIIASNSSAVEAIDGTTGTFIWQVTLEQILGPEQAAESIRAVSSPCVVPGGVVVVALRNREDRLEAYGARIDDGGTISWVRHLGEARGASWLGLRGSPATPVEGRGRVLWSTDRGSVISLRTSDGAIEWVQDLNGPGRDGLRDHLMKDLASGTSLRRRGSRLFASSPGSSRIHILDESTGTPLGVIAASSPGSWNVSTDGDRLLVIEEAEVVQWSCVAGSVPRFQWRRELPAPLDGRGADLSPARSGGWWIGCGDALLSITEHGDPITIQGLDVAAHSLTPLDGGLLASSGSRISLMTEAPDDGDEETRRWLDALSGHIDPRWLPDLAGSSPGQRSLRRTVRLLLDRSDLQLSSNERTRLETALVSSSNRTEDRIRLGWQRIVEAHRLEDAATGTFLCYLLLGEVWRPLNEIQVATPQGSTVSAALAITHMLLQFDKLPGGDERIRRREEVASRKTRDQQHWPETPQRWVELARSYPGCPTGRSCRLKAAEAYYQLGDLESCLRQLNLLAVRESETDAAVIARIRRSEVLREQGRISEALEEITDLEKTHGARPMTRTVDGVEMEITLGDRMQQLREEISNLPQFEDDHPGLPLHRVWSGRLDLGQTRTTSVWPLSEQPKMVDDPRYMVLTSSSAALFDSSDGLLLWRTELQRDPARVRDGIILTRRDLPSAPLLFDDSGVVLHDRTRIWRLDLTSGQVIWQLRIPIGVVVPDVTAEEEIIIEQSCGGSGVIFLSTEDERMIALDAFSGELLWNLPRTGLFQDDPQIRGDRLLIGYTIPDRVELRSLDNGDLIQEIVLGGDMGALASAPLLLDEGFLFATERGVIRRWTDTGEEAWSLEAPHLISNLQLSVDEKQVVCEMFWSAEKPTLLGIDVASGKAGWQKTMSQEQRRITSLHIDSNELLLVCGDFQQRSVLRLRAAMAPPGAELSEAELEWTHSMSPAYDTVELRPRGDWIVIADRMRGEAILLHRSSGTALSQRSGVAAVANHLQDLGRIHHASIIGDTLLTVSARGSAGFRAPSFRNSELAGWKSLSGPSTWKRETTRLLELDEIERAVEILEKTILDGGNPLRQRAQASWLLEGADRQRQRSLRQEHEIPRSLVPPRIDGSLEEPWSAAAGIPLDRPRHVRGLQGSGEARVPWQDRADLSARIFLGWSTEGLHIAVDIDDDIVTAHQRDSKRWIGDCLVLVLDCLGDGGVRPRSDDLVMTLAFMPPRQNKPAPAGDDPDGGGEVPPFEEDEDEDPEGEHVVVRRPDGMGAVYEMTIPWSTIAEQRGEDDAVPWAGMKMRLGIAVTDDDTGQGATKYIGLTPGMVLHRDLNRIWEGCSPELMLPVRLGR